MLSKAAIAKEFERLIASKGIRPEEIKAKIDFNKRVIRYSLTKFFDVNLDDVLRREEREIDKKLHRIKENGIN